MPTKIATYGILLAIFASFIPVSSSLAESKAPPTAALIGGTYVDAHPLPIAIVAGLKSYCSGLLVGPRVVLTAAHCLDDDTPAEQYQVAVGGSLHAVSAVQMHPSYEPNSPVSLSKSRFDIGLVTLGSAVLTVKPTPILLNHPLKLNDVISVQAFGSNEKPDSAFKTIYEEAKSADLKVEELYDGLIATSFSGSNAAMCSGDSGGPVTMKIGNVTVSVGTVSLGSTQLLDDGTCINANDGISAYVDLQSSYVQNFLEGNSGILFAPQKLITFSNEAEKITTEIKKVLSSKTKRDLVVSISRVRTEIRNLNKLADAKRLAKTKSALSLAVSIPKQKTLKAGIAQVKKLNGIIKALAALGAV